MSASPPTAQDALPPGPTLLPPNPKATATAAEERLFDALRHIEPDWFVFHSVGFVSPREGRNRDIEVDFVLVHPSRGVVVIEVKGGVVRTEAGRWFTRRTISAKREIEIADPFEQAQHARHNLRRYLLRRVPDLDHLEVGYAVAFPAGVFSEDLGANAPADIIIGQRDLGQLTSVLERVCAFWGVQQHIPASSLGHIVSILTPTTSLDVALVKAIETTEEAILELTCEQIALTEDQVRVYADLQSKPRLLVTGRPGTGKTILALDRAQRLAADGASTLLLCQGPHLAGYFAEALQVLGNWPKQLHVHTLVSLRQQVAKSANLSHEIRRPVDLRSAIGESPFRIDAVVVDEGQEFASGWLASVSNLLVEPASSPFYVFADPFQRGWYNLRDTEWDPPFLEPSFVLTTSCRMSRSIAEVLGRIREMGPVRREADGPDPEFFEADTRQAALEQITWVVQRLVDREDVLPRSIAVLAHFVDLADAIAEHLTRHGYQAVRYRGERHWRVRKNQLTVTTPGDFKGLEAEAVIACLWTPHDGLWLGHVRARDDETWEQRERRARSMLLGAVAEAYVMLSRARSYLAVIGGNACLRVLRGEVAPTVPPP